MFLTLFIIILSLAILLDYTAKKRRYDMTVNMPGPFLLPIFGSGFIFKRRDVQGIRPKFPEENFLPLKYISFYYS